MPRLNIIRGPEPGLSIDLELEVIRIGRGRKNEIIIHDNEVSREHCRLVRVLDDYEIFDDTSTNGTYVNGKKIDGTGWLLGARSIIELGDSITLEYLPNEDESGVAPVPSPSIIVETVEIAQPIYLMIKRESVAEREVYALDSKTITIGRDLSNDIVLPDAEVSRHHMRLTRMDGAYLLEDLNTLNGTHLNGEHVKVPMRLKTGDILRVGKMVTMFITADPALTDFAEPPTATATQQVPVDANPTEPRPGSTRLLTTTAVEGLTEINLEPDSLRDHIFIAYARRDWDSIVERLYRYLKENGVPAWVDQYHTPETVEWDLAIEQAMSECQCLVVVISELSLDIPYVQRGIRHFLAREKPLLLFTYQKVEELPLTIRSMPVVAHDPANPERVFRTVLAELRKLSVRG